MEMLGAYRIIMLGASHANDPHHQMQLRIIKGIIIVAKENMKSIGVLQVGSGLVVCNLGIGKSIKQ